FATVAVQLIADAGRVDFHRCDTNIALGHHVEATINLSHAWIRIEAVALWKSDLERIVLSILLRKVFDSERVTVAFNLVDQLRRNVMMMNVDGRSGSARGLSRPFYRVLRTARQRSH